MKKMGFIVLCGISFMGTLFFGSIRSEAQTVFRAGTWLALGTEYGQFYSFDVDELSGQTASLENGMGVPFQYEWEGEQVNFHMGAADTSQYGTVTQLDEDHLMLEWDSGVVETLSYYSEADLYHMHFFTNEELCQMALYYYESRNGLEDSGLCAAAGTNEDGTVIIQVYENLSDHNSTAAWYQVDRRTGEGESILFGEPVKLTNGAPEIAIAYAEPELLQNLLSYDKFVIDDSEYHSEILLTAEVPVTDFSVVSIEWVPDESGETDAFCINEELYSLEELVPETPLVLSLSMPETIPNIGICYRTYDGEMKLYSIGMSGLDGSPLLMKETMLES